MVYPQDEFKGPPGGGDGRDPDKQPETGRVLSSGAGAMTPLDTGSSPEIYTSARTWDEPPPSLADFATLGEGLKAARERSGKSMGELSTATRVHSRYLTALEKGDYSALPSRPFSLGYVRAYAAALGLDEHLAADRFKREAPDQTEALRPPTGADFQDVKRHSPRLIGVAALVVCAVVGWNVFQRISLMQAPHPSDIAEVPESWTLGTVPGVVRLGAPQPAPPDQTIPALYVTPGLEAELTGVDPDTAAGIAAAAAAAPPVQAAFNPQGAIYGASPGASQVVLQARRAASLVVRMADGRVLFARQLAAGEAWRAPAGVSAVVDVSEPSAFDVYLNGEHGGALQAVITPLSQLNSRAERLARQAAASVVARTEAAREAAADAVDAASTTAANAG